MRFARVSVGIWLVLGILIVISLRRDLKVRSYNNWNYAAFSRIMATDHIKAMERQAVLERFAEYLGLEQRQHDVADTFPETSMLQAIFIGEYHRLRGDKVEAAQWYRQAAKVESEPVWQRSLSYAQRSRLLPDGSMNFDEFSDVSGWVLDQVNSNVVDAVFESQDGIAILFYQNQLDRRDTLAYMLYPEGGIRIGYHSLLSIRVKISPDSYLTVETKIDDILNRHVRYYSGTGEWEKVKIPLAGDTLQMVKLIFNEPGDPPPTTATHGYWLDWIRLELSE